MTLKVRSAVLLLLMNIIIISGCASADRNLSPTAQQLMNTNDILALKNLRADILVSAESDSLIGAIDSFLYANHMANVRHLAKTGKLDESLNQVALATNFRSLSPRDSIFADKIHTILSQLDTCAHVISSADTIHYLNTVSIVKSIESLNPEIGVIPYVEVGFTKGIIANSVELASIVTNSINTPLQVLIELLEFYQSHKYYKSNKSKYPSNAKRAAQYINAMPSAHPGIFKMGELNNRLAAYWLADLTRVDSSLGDLTEYIDSICVEYAKQALGSHNPTYEYAFDLRCMYSLGYLLDTHYLNLIEDLGSSVPSGIYIDYVGDSALGHMIADYYDTPDYTSATIMNVSLSDSPAFIHVAPDSERRQVSSQYIAGTKIIDNPEWYRISNELQNEIYTHNNLVETLPSNKSTIGAFLYGVHTGKISNSKRRIGQLESRLTNTPPMVEVSDIRAYTYTEITTKISGTYEFTLRAPKSEGIRASTPAKVSISDVKTSYTGVNERDVSSATNKESAVPSHEIVSALLSMKAIRSVQDYWNTSRTASTASIIGDLRDKASNTFLFERQGIDRNSQILTTYLAYIDDQLSEFRSEIEKLSVASKSSDIISYGAKNTAYSDFSNLKDAVQYAQRATYRVVAFSDDYTASTGTAYIISDTGICVTNHHVVDNAQYVMLTKNIRGTTVSRIANILASDPDIDIAILQLNGISDEDETIRIDTSYRAEIGDEIFYVGYPGTALQEQSSIFLGRGNISQVINNDNEDPLIYMLDVTANPGSSGSAILSFPSGKLLGTLSWGYGRSISQSDLLRVIQGNAIRIQESENYCTSLSVMMSLLK